MSRYRLNFFDVDQKPGQDVHIRLAIGDVYGPIVDAAIPELRHIGWRRNDKGVRYTFAKGASQELVERVRAFLELHRNVVTLTCPLPVAAKSTGSFDLCYALSLNFEPDLVTRTVIGELERQAKYEHDLTAVNELSTAIAKFVLAHPSLASSTFVTPVACHVAKPFDLPMLLAKQVSKLCGIPLRIALEKIAVTASVKTLPVLQRQAAVENAFRVPEVVVGASVLLIDDLYQSGSTMWTLARLMKAQGASRVFGVSCVKSMRDTDNV